MSAAVERLEIRKAALFSNVPMDLLDEIAANSLVKSYRPRELVCRAGQPAKNVFVILDGIVQIYRGRNGKHAVIAVMQRDDVFGLCAALTSSVHTETAEAIGECRVLEISGDLFAELTGRDAGLAAQTINALSSQLQNSSDQLERIQLMPTAQRLADYLLRLAPERNGAFEIKLPFGKRLIATYLGMEPESLSRAMRLLGSYGLTCKGRRVRVQDAETLRAIFATGEH